MKAVFLAGLLAGAFASSAEKSKFEADFARGWDSDHKATIQLPEVQVPSEKKGKLTIELPEVEIPSESELKHWRTEFTLDDIPGLDFKALFEAWKADNEKSYSSVEEEAERFLVFIDAVYTIAEENSRGLTYKLALNQFGDMTRDEFRDFVGGCRSSDMPEPQNLNDFTSDPSNPSEVNWNAQGKVTPVKNQGSCGSCWAFSSTGALECNYAIKHGTLNSLSEQELVDCSRSYGNYGCSGGWWYNAFDYVKDKGGLCSESEYPYTARDGTCNSNCGTRYNDISGYTSVTADSESALETAVASGCVSVGVEADQYAWQYYSSGVLTGTCGANIDHGVLAVGYNNNESTKYWIVKNSWGTGWGQGGYVYVCKECGKNGNEGECGILMYDAYPNPR
jgi:C1A family cysteine protease